MPNTKPEGLIASALIAAIIGCVENAEAELDASRGCITALARRVLLPSDMLPGIIECVEDAEAELAAMRARLATLSRILQHQQTGEQE